MSQRLPSPPFRLMPLSGTALLMLLASTPVLANDAAYNSGTLSAVVVSARPLSPENIASVSVVTQEDIEASHAATLDEALRLLPGKYESVGGQASPRLQVR